jgi:hypothetical protein
LVALCLFGCHSTPTTATGFMVTITAVMSNTAAAATILDAQLLFDGVLAQDLLQTAGVSTVSFSVSGGTSAGAHTLTFLMANQTTAPNTYSVSAGTIVVYDINGTLLKTIPIPTQSMSLATDGSISFNFSL